MNKTEVLLKILFDTYSKLDEESRRFIENYSEKNILCVDPDSIKTLQQKFQINIDKNLLISQAFYLIAINLSNKGVRLLKDFNLIVREIQEEYDSKYNLVKALVLKNDIKNLSLVVLTSKAIAKKSIDILCEHKLFEHAENIIIDNKLNYLEFPIYLKKSIKRSLYHFVFDDKLIVSTLIELTEDDLLARSCLIEILFEGSTNNAEWMGKIATCLLKLDKRVMNHVDPKYLPHTISDITYVPVEDTFGPVSPGCTVLPAEVKVIFVDNEEKVRQMNWDGENCVGLDSEWKTGIGGKFVKTKNSILQIAMTNKVYIIDLTIPEIQSEIDSKLYELFGNSVIYKVGISFSGDILRLEKSFPHMICFQSQFRSYIDLIDVHKRNQKNNPGGLSGLCEIYLDRQVCKTEQISNWERRPLRLRQIHYAALDAYLCIALIYKYTDLNIIIGSDVVQVLGFGENKSNGNLEKYSATCDGCKSIKHASEKCFKLFRCRICGFIDHQVENCPCLVKG